MAEAVVKAVADCVSTLREKFAADCLKSFRARAREVPAMVFSRGLAYAIVYVASRSSEEVFGIGLNSGSCPDLVEGVRKYLEKAKAEREEAGYALYGALLAFTMKAGGLARASDFRGLIEAVLKDPTVNYRALEVVEWIKRFAEAYVAEPD